MATSRAGGGAGPNAPLLAYVLHRHDWSESSLIVELFSRARGRVVVVAKGAKKPTSNFRAVLLPFAPLHAVLGRTPVDEQAEIHTLRSAEWAGGAPPLRGEALLAGFYCNELLLKLLARHDPHGALFDRYADTLAALGGDEAGTTALRAFELGLLRALGWLPELTAATLTTQPVQPQQRYTLQPEAGLIEVAQGGVPGADWVAIEAALAHGSGSALRAACRPVAAALAGPLRALLHYHLGHATLHTRQVWQGVHKLARTERNVQAGATER